MLLSCKQRNSLAFRWIMISNVHWQRQYILVHCPNGRTNLLNFLQSCLLPMLMLFLIGLKSNSWSCTRTRTCTCTRTRTHGIVLVLILVLVRLYSYSYSQDLKIRYSYSYSYSTLCTRTHTRTHDLVLVLVLVLVLGTRTRGFVLTLQVCLKVRMFNTFFGFISLDSVMSWQPTCPSVVWNANKFFCNS